MKMRKTILALAVIFIVSAVICRADDKTIYPEIDPEYSAVIVSGDFRIIHCSEDDTLHIVANEKVLENIECLLDENTLRVRYKEGKGAKAVLSGRSPIIYLPASEYVKKIILEGTTHMECTAPLTTDDLAIKLSGTARVIGEVQTQNLQVTCSGTSNVTITGKAESFGICINGASRVSAGEGFECRTANIDVNGAGVVRINCIEKISGELSGTAIVKYLSSPELSIKTNGLSSIKAID